MTVDVKDFKPTSKIKDGKNGLANSRGSRSHAKIEGVNLADGLAVKVYLPAGSTTLVWEGTTFDTKNNNTRCRASLNNIGSEDAAQGPREGDTTVTVTVGDSTRQNFDVQTGPPLEGGVFGGVQWDWRQLQMARSRRHDRRQIGQCQ